MNAVAVRWYDETTETLAGKSLEDLAAIWRSADSVNWLKGDIAREVTTHYGNADLERFADLVGEKLSTVQEYRRIAKKYPEKSRRMDISWSVHQVFASQDDRVALIAGWTGTVAEAEKFIHDRKTGGDETGADAAIETGRNAGDETGTPDYRANAEALNEQVRAEAANAGEDKQHDHDYKLICAGDGYDPVAAKDFKAIGSWLGFTFKPKELDEILKYAKGE